MTCPRCDSPIVVGLPHREGSVACDYAYARLLARRPGWILATTPELASAWDGDKVEVTSSDLNRRRLGAAGGYGWVLGPWHGVPSRTVIALAKGRTTRRKIDAIREVAARLQTDDAFREAVDAEVGMATLAQRSATEQLKTTERAHRTPQHRKRKTR